MSLRRRQSRDEEAGVNLSPLIDCVFLLLIFFLTTTMFKRFEHQIPIRMPDITSSLSEQAQEQLLHVGMRRNGTFHRQGGLGPRGELQFQRGEPLDAIIQDLAKARQFDDPIRLVVEKQTRFQDVITALDEFQLAGFQDVDVRVTNQIRTR